MLICLSLQAQKIEINSGEENSYEIQILKSEAFEFVFRCKINFFNLEKNSFTDEFSVNIPHGGKILEKGKPDLATLTFPIQVPNHYHLQVELKDYQIFTQENIKIKPSQGNLYRNEKPDKEVFYDVVYQKNKFFPAGFYDLQKEHIIRGIKGQSILFYPFSYNARQQKLQVLKEFTICCRFIPDEKPGQFSLTPKARSAAFERLYKHHFINYKKEKYTFPEDEGDYLILCPHMYIPAIESLADWKIRLGYPTTIADLDTIGNSPAEIKNFIANFYQNNDLAYVLLVGDAEQLTPSYTEDDSDNDYVCIEGDDHYPDAMIGRLSGESVEMIENQVSKIIDYEKTPDVSGNWFSHGIGIGSNDPRQGQGDEYDWQHIRFIREDLLNYHYTNVSELYDGDQGGDDAPGNPTTDDVVNEINEGTTIINYTGHGNHIGWQTTLLSNDDVNELLTNHHQYPFIISVGCKNGDFVDQTCFAEAWMRTTHMDEPAGAIGFLGSTGLQTWTPPMDAQDEITDVLTELATDNTQRSLGGIVFSGLMKMIDLNGPSGEIMSDLWILFGEPSLWVRNAMPDTLSAIHADELYVGSTSFKIFTAKMGANVILSKDGKVIENKIAGEDTLTFEFDPIDVGLLQICVKNYNSIPYIADIPVIPANGPYVVYEHFEINDSLGNDNGLAESGEEIFLHLGMKNIGNETAENIQVNIACQSDYIQFLDDSSFYMQIEPNHAVTKQNTIRFQVVGNIPNNHTILFTLSSQNNKSWLSYFSITFYAPVLSIGKMIVNDQIGWERNRRIDIGESCVLQIPVFNAGNSVAYSSMSYLQCDYEHIIIQDTVFRLENIGVGDTDTASFIIQTSEDAENGDIYNFVFKVQSALYKKQKTFTDHIGYNIEDFETFGFERFNWFREEKPWKISAQQPYEGFVSASAYNLENNERAILKLYMYLPHADSIHFMQRTDCETYHDELSFYIDTVKQAAWSGQQTWQTEHFFIEQGYHTIWWEYKKNESFSSGADAAWIDYIVFPTFYGNTPVDNIQTENQYMQLKTFPNPSNGKFTVQISSTVNANAQLFLYDIHGLLINTKDCYLSPQNPFSVSFDIQNMPAGIYFVSLQWKEKTFTEKIIKF